ncbi:hypothetical protein AOL_s00054g758 [Orbilia oligospora ATCC 24927]|uniref:Uncharacterized protein n=1 Tax=Arthrobotrys oligospora (strain ATCC 24927 / CBS 115.81 / DSM 1491) TaxID=756982 RepID=G1X7B4_ARTOA|nr:hypothetical protein AOL_s00054g758 [Orbilia oligospora ATCC 24927]EGX51022.1 hypothetical protein AOL_s00054g758 [Orbilia oligospora ATCC 24927]
MMPDDFAMTDTAMAAPQSSHSHSTQAPKLKQPSYLIAYLQKSELFSNTTDNRKNKENSNNDTPKIVSKSNGSSLHSSRGSLHDRHHEDEDEDEKDDENEDEKDHYEEITESARSARNSLLVEQFWANTQLHLAHDSSDDAADDEEGLEDDDDDGYDDFDSDSYQDPDELTNLPYKSPAVYQLPGSGNGNKFRTLVRNGPVGSAEGEAQRFVVIKRRSFRGAGLYPEEMVDVDVEMGGCVVLGDEENNNDNRNRNNVKGGKDEDGDEDEDEDERLEGEVEVMWSEDGEEFWLVRDPAENGGIGKETSWVSKEWFILRRKMMGKGQAGRGGEGEKQRVELRVPMETD